jgi:hypothetical protein
MPARLLVLPAGPAGRGSIQLTRRRIRQQLQELGYFCKGTVLERRMKCGQPRCACHRDPSQRHGPYWEWTYKVRGKTVNVRLSSEAGPIYRAASRQHRKLKALLDRLERVARTGLAAQAKKAKTDSTV